MVELTVKYLRDHGQAALYLCEIIKPQQFNYKFVELKNLMEQNQVYWIEAALIANEYLHQCVNEALESNNLIVVNQKEVSHSSLKTIIYDMYSR